MSYRVIYDKEEKREGSGIRFRMIPLTGIAVVAFLLLVNACWPRGQEVLSSLILPEAVNTALTAVNTFAEEIISGDPVPEAWEAFCYEIGH